MQTPVVRICPGYRPAVCLLIMIIITETAIPGSGEAAIRISGRRREPDDHGQAYTGSSINSFIVMDGSAIPARMTFII